MPRGAERKWLWSEAQRRRVEAREENTDRAVRRERARILWILRSEARQAREAAAAALVGRRLVRESDFQKSSAAHAEAARELAYAGRLEGIVLTILSKEQP